MPRTTEKRASRNPPGKNVTLDLDAPVVSPETLKQAVSAFVELIQEVSSEVAGSGSKIQWDMAVQRGSRLFIARALANTATVRTTQIAIKAISDGVRLLERGTNLQPPFFNERALKAARSLATLRDGKTKRLSYIRIRSTGKPAEITARSVVSVDRLLTGQHQAYGSVEGKLQTLSERGQLQFVVYDDLFDKGVNCFLDDEHAQEAVQAFRKRVAVRGLVQYDADGRPVSIRVDAIRIFRDVSELPTFDELQGIFQKAE